MLHNFVADRIEKRIAAIRARRGTPEDDFYKQAAALGFSLVTQPPAGDETELLKRVRHNETRSKLHALPTEILQLILGHLESGTWDVPLARFTSTGSLLSASLACRKFRALIGPVKASERDGPPSFAEIQRAAHYRAAICALEVHGRLTRGHLACAGCRTAHHARDFDDVEVSVPPERRRCRGRRASFKMCEHRSVSLDSVERAAGSLYSRLSCGHNDHVRDSKPPALDIEHSGKLVYQSSVRLLRWNSMLPESEAAAANSPVVQRLLEALGEADLYVCPHLRSGSPYITSRLRYFHTGWGGGEGFGFGFRSKTCPHEACATIFGVHVAQAWPRAADGTPEAVGYVLFELRVRRVIGAMCADNPKWLAQLEQQDERDERLERLRRR